MNISGGLRKLHISDQDEKGLTNNGGQSQAPVGQQVNYTRYNGGKSVHKGNEGKKDKNIKFRGPFPPKKIESIPRLTYSDPYYYFNTYSHALFLEEKLENKFFQSFKIHWPGSDLVTLFDASIEIDGNIELQGLLLQRPLELGTNLFDESQVLCLATQDESSVWYTYVEKAKMDTYIFGEPRSMTLSLRLFRWNKTGLAADLSDDRVKVLLCGPQTSRIFLAMTRIENSKFMDLILGKKPIQEVTPTEKLDYSRQDMNESQRNAIEHVLSNDITIIQGPPGAGKTSTIEELIIQLSKCYTLQSRRFLIIAASNIAVDNIAERFMGRRDMFKILRIVSDFKRPQYDENHPLGEICLHNIVVARLQEDLKEVEEKMRTGKQAEVSKQQYEKLVAMQNLLFEKSCRESQIIFTTTITAGGRALQGIRDISAVIMDESTQSSEAATLVPLALPGVRKFVFVGDEKQLSSFSQIPQLQMSLFERILRNGCCKNPHMLDTQYRMHPTISEFPRQKFYRGLLKDGVTQQQKSWENIHYPLFFLRCSDCNETIVNKRDKTYTYINGEECHFVREMIRKLILEKNVTRDEIGVIVPYSAQRDAVSQILVEDTVINPEKIPVQQNVDETDLCTGRKKNKGNSINIVNDIYIATIDSFQGHEKNFILFSTVRNNLEAKIGFLVDRRRMTVALTRARNGLIIVGNDLVLGKRNHIWKDYIEYLQSRKLIFTDLNYY